MNTSYSCQIYEHDQNIARIFSSFHLIVALFIDTNFLQ